ncbi:MAG: hypothetical protein RLY20_2709 [Verrucomicrobiota bacterium]
MKKSLIQIVVALLCCTGITHSAVASIVNAFMPFRYEVVQGGKVFTGTYNFPGLGFTPTGDYCPANHLDPDGNRYEHAHLPHNFPFSNNASGFWLTVWEQWSDWAWDDYYSGYTRDSGSTFAKNCYAYATGAPQVLFSSGYSQFTSASSKCENTTKGKSYENNGHDHVITFTVEFNEYSCDVKHTSEKNASGGVYSMDWGWYAIVNAVRKNKL